MSSVFAKFYGQVTYSDGSNQSFVQILNEQGNIVTND